MIEIISPVITNYLLNKKPVQPIKKEKKDGSEFEPIMEKAIEEVKRNDR